MYNTSHLDICRCFDDGDFSANFGNIIVWYPLIIQLWNLIIVNRQIIELNGPRLPYQTVVFPDGSQLPSSNQT